MLEAHICARTSLLEAQNLFHNALDTALEWCQVEEDALLAWRMTSEQVQALTGNQWTLLYKLFQVGSHIYFSQGHIMEGCLFAKTSLSILTVGQCWCLDSSKERMGLQVTEALWKRYMWKFDEMANISIDQVHGSSKRAKNLIQQSW